MPWKVQFSCVQKVPRLRGGTSSAPRRERLGSEEGTARLRGAIGSAPGKKKKDYPILFLSR